MVVCRQGGAKLRSRRQARARLAVGEDSRDMHRSELLRVALEPAATDREVLGDPDRDAPAVNRALVRAAHDDEGLEVLRSNRIEKF